MSVKRKSYSADFKAKFVLAVLEGEKTITYIKLEKSFIYLATIIDWHSKKIFSWKLSNTMDVSLTTAVLKEALALYPKTEIFNTAQGSQYTSKAHTDILKKHHIKISYGWSGQSYR